MLKKIDVGIALFVYRRPDLTERVMEGLRKNGFKKIYVFQDGYADGTDKKRWEDVSRIINSMDFADIEVHISKEHKGLAPSVINAMNYVFERHEFVVGLEDDIILADGYKEFLEECIEKYQDNPCVMGICGGSFGVLIPDNYPYDIFFSYRMSSAAFGTWRVYWEEFCKDYFENPFVLQNIYKDPSVYEIFKKSGNDLEDLIYGSLRGEVHTWAAYWCLYQIMNKGLEIIPSKALITDAGHHGDGGGTNSIGWTDRFDPEPAEKWITPGKLPDDVIIDPEIIEDSRIVISKKTDADRYLFYMPLMYKWVRALQQGKRIEDYFRINNISKIYIFGTGIAGRLIYFELLDKQRIKGFLEENAVEENINEIPVFSVREKKIDMRIPILITPSHDKEYLIHLIKKNGVMNELIWIDDVIEAIYNQTQ